MSLLSSLVFASIVACALSNDILTVTPPPDSCSGPFDPAATQYCSVLEPYLMNNSLIALPNERGHQNQAEVNSELTAYAPLIRISCSGAILEFLCSYYLPLCFEVPQAAQIVRLKPCRSLCEEVYDNCADDLEINGYPWPEHLNCSAYFPEENCYSPPEDPSNIMLPEYIPGIGTITPPPPTTTINTKITPTTTNAVIPSTTTSQILDSSETRTQTSTYNRPMPVSTTTTTVRPTQRPTESVTEDPFIDRNISGANSLHATVSAVSLLLIIALAIMQTMH